MKSIGITFFGTSNKKDYPVMTRIWQAKAKLATEKINISVTLKITKFAKL